jgi:penicillin-binding protein 1C
MLRRRFGSALAVRSRRARAALSLSLALCLGGGFALWLAVGAARVQLPAGLRDSGADASLWLLDRSGQSIARVRTRGGELEQQVTLAELSPFVVPATLAAEDARFFAHPGVDPLALGRALFQALRHGRVVSGASTLTQQLARQYFERPRTWLGKAREIALALRMEASFDKASILEAYLNQVDVGPRLRGVQAASQYYFDKPARALSLAEAATLAALVRGATRYDPSRHPQRLRERRDYVLGRMLQLGLADAEAVARAQRSTLELHRGYLAPGAFHFVRALVQGKLGDPVRGVVTSTLDAPLQGEVEAAVRAFATGFDEHRASAAAVLVVDNAAAEVRAYVGAPDHRSRERLGQNDGALALRQPGSTLKPFVYALGMRDLGLHAASVLSDLERRFGSDDGVYVPQNYDRRFHGPVRLAAALAASLNVPAAALAERLGPEHVRQFLQRLGFAHLHESGQKYGPGIALGVAEVQLVELAAAYATLARGGEYLPLAFVAGGPRPPPERVLSPEISAQLAAILSDPRERAATFGREGPLEFELPVAVKTGTSKGNRDNWVVGFSPELTVAVWVGNFDGSPMLHSTGATGAGPLFHAVMLAALRSRAGSGAALAALTPALPAESHRICALSGQLAGADCPEPVAQAFWTEQRPRELCTWHERRCASAPGTTTSARKGAPRVECQSEERLPERYVAWGHDSGRAGEPAGRTHEPSGRRPAPVLPALVFPEPRTRFVLDGHLSTEQQQIVLTARAPAAERLVFELDGAVVCEVGVPFKCPWQLERGSHAVRVLSSHGASPSVRFSVE